MNTMDKSEIEDAIKITQRLQRILIEASAETPIGRYQLLARAQVNFEALALAMGRKVLEREEVA